MVRALDCSMNKRSLFLNLGPTILKGLCLQDLFLDLNSLCNWLFDNHSNLGFEYGGKNSDSLYGASPVRNLNKPMEIGRAHV